MKRTLLITDEEPASYLIKRVTDSQTEAARAGRETRELDYIQRKRGQKKPPESSQQPTIL